jgi:hypothetical protein
MLVVRRSICSLKLLWTKQPDYKALSFLLPRV